MHLNILFAVFVSLLIYFVSYVFFEEIHSFLFVSARTILSTPQITVSNGTINLVYINETLNTPFPPHIELIHRISTDDGVTFRDSNISKKYSWSQYLILLPVLTYPCQRLTGGQHSLTLFLIPSIEV
jgi:hypothetical protein